MQELQLLNTRIELLLKRYAALQDENNRLKSTIAEQQEQIEGLNKKLVVLEEHLVSAQDAKRSMGTQEKDQIRQQLDQVIEEIDKILGTLND